MLNYSPGINGGNVPQWEGADKGPLCDPGSEVFLGGSARVMRG